MVVNHSIAFTNVFKKFTQVSVSFHATGVFSSVKAATRGRGV